MNKTRLKAEFLLVLVTVIWGGTFAFIKTGLEDSSPLMLLAVRFGAAFLLFTVLYYKKFQFHGRQTIINGIVLGIFMFIGYAAQTVGLAYTTASKAGFISFTFALFVPFLQIWILKRRPLMGNVLGLIVVFAGIWIISRPTGGPFNIGDFIMVFAAVGYAFFIIFMDIINKKESPELMTSIQFLVTAVLSFAASFIFETPKLSITPSFLLSIAYLVILGSVFCLYMMNLYQKDTTPMRAVLIYVLEPVFGVLFAVILLGEAFSLREAGGALLILVGVLVSELWEIIGLGKRGK